MKTMKNNSVIFIKSKIKIDIIRVTQSVIFIKSKIKIDIISHDYFT
jgi:hypothetical protein